MVMGKNFSLAIRRIIFLVLVGWLVVFPASSSAREVQAKTRLLANTQFVDTLLDKVAGARSSIIMTSRPRTSAVTSPQR